MTMQGALGLHRYFITSLAATCLAAMMKGLSWRSTSGDGVLEEQEEDGVGVRAEGCEEGREEGD